MPTQLSALPSGTPTGTDILYGVGDPGGTPTDEKWTVDALLGVVQGTFKNALDPDTGITGDGTTDDSGAIDALLTQGGSVYFPAATYHLGAGMNIDIGSHLQVVCSPGAVFDTTGETIDDDLFSWRTAAGTTPLRFSWTGGIINVSVLTNAHSNSLKQKDHGFVRQGTAATTDCFSFRSFYWSDIHIEGVHFYTKQDAHLYSPFDVFRQHWMGDYTRGYISGGDSGIYIDSGPGTFTIKDCMFAGFRDSCVYIGGTGNSNATPPTLGRVTGCKFYHSANDVSVKALADEFIRVDNCQSYNVWRSFGVDHQASDGRAGAGNVTYADCTTTNFYIGFDLNEAKNTRIAGCRAINPGHLDWGGSLRGSSGKVTLTGGASGSVNSITVNGGANILSSAVSFTTNLQTTALAVAANINAHTSTYAASVYETSLGSDDWVIGIHTTDDAAEVDGTTVAVTTTTITATTEDMTYLSAPTGQAPTTALYPDGCSGLYVSDFDVSVTSEHAAQVASQRSGLDMIAVGIRSMAAADSSTGSAVQSLDNTIDGIRIQGVTSLGGEFTVSGPTNPDRTQIRNVTVHNDVTDHTGFALLGASSFASYTDRRRKRVTTQQDVTSSTAYVDSVLSFPNLKNNAIYAVRGMLAMSCVGTVGDTKLNWTTPAGTEPGWWTALSIASSGTSATAAVYTGARTWGQSQTAIGLLATATPLIIEIKGEIELLADGTVTLQFSQETPSAETTSLLVGSWLEFERIG